jgi:hypothetical protein
MRNETGTNQPASRGRRSAPGVGPAGRVLPFAEVLGLPLPALLPAVLLLAAGRALAFVPPSSPDPDRLAPPPLHAPVRASLRHDSSEKRATQGGSLEDVARTETLRWIDGVSPGSRIPRPEPEATGWRVAQTLHAPTRSYVHLEQMEDGRPVLGTRVTCIFGTGGDLLEIRAHTHPRGLPRRSDHEISLSAGRSLVLPGLIHEAAAPPVWIEESEEWIVIDGTEGPEFVPILRYRYRPTAHAPAYEAWIDATSGEILARDPLARHVSGRIEADVEPVTAGDPPVRTPLAQAHVHVRNLASGATTTTTTATDGSFTVSTDEAERYVVRTDLAGPAVRVLDGTRNFTTPADSAEVSGQEPFSYHWTATEATPASRDAFYHANLAYGFARALDPSDVLAPLDAGIDVRVDDPVGSCNAYWDGEGLTFYAAGGICVATGRVADVVYHEYGHAVTTQIYRPFRIPRDLDEAFSDYFAATLTGSAEIGRGLYGQPGTYIRELESDRIWPEDANPTSPHQQGLILAGALWDLRTSLGPEVADPLFHYARYALPESFDEVLLAVLDTDDDDDDRSNGTPHFEAIIAAFRPHGIGDYSVAIEAEPLPDVEVPPVVLEARAHVRSLLGLSADDLRFHFRIGPEGPFTDVELVPGAGSREFLAQFPTPPSGSIVQYYWSAADTAGTAATLPAGAPEEFLSFQVGADLVPPELVHRPSEFLTADQVDLALEATVTDNSGRLAEVRVEYGLEGQVPLQNAPLLAVGGGLHRAEIPLGPLPTGSVAVYRIVAVDASLGANLTTFPADGTQRVVVRKGRTAPLEAEDGGLTAQGDWEWGQPVGVPAPPHGSRVWATRLAGPSTPLSVSTLTWGPIAMDPGSPRRLEFAHYHDFIEGVDGGRVLVSTNGTSFTAVVPGDGYPGLAEAFEGAAFTGRTEGWRRVSVALDRFPGTQLWIRWESRSIGAVSAPGWYLDELQVVSAQARVDPDDFVAETGQSARVPLSWDPPLGIDPNAGTFLGYEVLRAVGDEPFGPTPWRTGLRVTQVLDEEVDNGTTYRYLLRALYGEGPSEGVERLARPAAPVFSFPVSELEFRLAGTAQSDTTLFVRNTGEGILEFNAYLANPDDTVDDVRIRVPVAGLGDAPTVVHTDPPDSFGPDIAEIRVARSQGVTGDALALEIVGHEPWHDPIGEFGGVLLLDTDQNLATGPESSVFGWGEDENLGWDVAVLFGRIAREQGGLADALLVHADDLDRLETLRTVSLPEDSDRIGLEIPLAELGDPREVDLAVILANQRLAPPLDRVPELPDLDWLRREPRRVRIRPGESRPFSLEFDASVLGNGAYEGQVLLTSNDPLAPHAALPVRLEVGGIVPADLDTRSFRSLETGLEVGFATPRGLIATSAHIERSRADANLWTVLTASPLVPDELGRFLFVDGTATPRVRFDYRIRMAFAGLTGFYVFGPYEATYRPDAPSEFAFVATSANPFRAGIDLQLDVAEAGTARVEAFSVDGRRLETLLDQPVEAGRYPLRWDSAPGRGIYWVRAEVSGAGVRVLRLVRLQ